MRDDQLNEIESALGVTLPTAYRQISRAFPFKPIGRDWVYWFYDNPARVLHDTRFPHEDGGYAGPHLLPRYVAIGQSAAGDAYLLDTITEGSPVVCLSHETHAIEPEWPTFEAFVDEWLRAPAAAEKLALAERERMRGWWRRAWLIAAVIGLFAFALPLLLFCMAAGQ